MSRMPHHQNAPRRPETPPPPPIRESYLQAVYVTFWKPIYFSLAMVQSLVCIWLLIQIVEEPAGYWFAFIFMLFGVIAYVELELFAHAMHWTDEPIWDWGQRVTWIVVIGYGLAMVLVLMFAIGEERQQDRAVEIEAQRQQEKERWRETVNSPDVQRGIEAMAAIEAARQRRLAQEAAEGDAGASSRDGAATHEDVRAAIEAMRQRRAASAPGTARAAPATVPATAPAR